MRANAVSAPTSMAVNVNAPVVLTVPPVTRSPARLAAGTRLARDH
jgi:hypothetical protein